MNKENKQLKENREGVISVLVPIRVDENWAFEMIIQRENSKRGMEYYIPSENGNISVCPIKLYN